MLKKIRQNWLLVLEALYGRRLKDNKCAFCGEILAPGEYCFCPGARKINPFYKRVSEKLDDYELYDSDKEQYRYSLMRLFKISNVPVKYSGLQFDDYKEFVIKDKKIKETVIAYFDEAIKNYLTGKSLLLLGKSGTGKTMLLSILAESIIQKYMLEVRYINCVDLINKIQGTYSQQTHITTQSVLKKYSIAEFLIIDDLDKMNATADSKKIIYSIINDRYERVLPTIISANSSVDTLDEKYFDEPTVSRLLERSVEVILDQENRRF